MAKLSDEILDKLTTELAKFPAVATTNDHYMALSFAVRDRLLRRWVNSARSYLEERRRTVIYLSAEYLIGPQLGSNLMALELTAEARAATAELGVSLDALLDHEEEPGLGNGGLGRLAACYMDSLATLDIPAVGHGLRYEFGIFDQEIRDGWQQERTDRWLRTGFPWEVRRFEIELPVGFGGRTEHGANGARCDPGAHRQGRAVGCPGPGVRHRDHELPAAVERRRRRGVRPRRVPGRRVLARGRLEDPQREPHEGALPQRFEPGRQAAPARAAVLLRLVRAPGLHSHPAPARDDRRVRRQVRGPAQRHPPGAGGPRADAAAVDVHGLGWDAAWRDHARAPSRTRTTR